MLLKWLNGEVDGVRFASLIVVFVVAITVHEFAHAYVAWRCGDQTPKANGRISLNPVDHLDPIGSIAILLSSFGWGKPVLVNPLNFDSPRIDNIRVAAAGPMANLIMASIAAGLSHLLSSAGLGVVPWDQFAVLSQLLYLAVMLNIGLALFNLIPVFPLDGHHVVGGLLPDRAADSYRRSIGGPMGMIVLMLLLATGVVGDIIAVPMSALMGLLGM